MQNIPADEWTCKVSWNQSHFNKLEVGHISYSKPKQSIMKLFKNKNKNKLKKKNQ